MANYGTQDFEPTIEAKARFEHVPSYEIELAARRMRAEAIADLARKAVKAVREFFATRPAPVAAGHKLTEIEKARVAQGEAIANTVILAQGKVREFFAARPAPAPAAEGYRLSEQDVARLAQAEAIADAVLAVSRFVSKLVSPIVAKAKAWRIQSRTRDELEALDDRTLADIGLSRNDIPRVAAGMWAPEARAARTSYAAPASAINLNKPQIAA